MKIRARIRNSRDFMAGLLFILLGLIALVVASGYPMGSARNIGPGYFPVLLGGLLILLGGAIAVSGIALSREPVRGWAVRPLILVTAAVIGFGLLVRPLGLVLATVALILVSSLAGSDFNLRRTIVLTMGLVALAAGIFIYGLGLPFSLWPR